MRDGKEITIRIYTPEATCVPNNGSPLYVAYHEGGFTAGDLTDESYCTLKLDPLGIFVWEELDETIEHQLVPRNPLNGLHDQITKTRVADARDRVFGMLGGDKKDLSIREPNENGISRSNSHIHVYTKPAIAFRHCLLDMFCLLVISKVLGVASKASHLVN